VIEMDDEGFVLIFAQKVIEEGTARGDFLIEDAALAAAGVHEEAEGERKIGFAGEVGDGLGFAVLVEGEIVLGEIVDEGAVFVADGGEEVYGADVDGDGSLLRDERGSQKKEEKEGAENAENRACGGYGPRKDFVGRALC